ncbi:MAG: hypothetical protein J6J42_13585 [Lachnospiraceae bacterium]|nr:hypothetical protein [Lachnospiraceae bacterium]MBP3611355.1 hypothetical protein [Lachnospiraceae bacterium]
MKIKASFTVEAALVFPLLSLVICGMLLLTLRLYGKVEQYAGRLQTEERQGIPSTELIRLEAVIEEVLQE